MLPSRACVSNAPKRLRLTLRPRLPGPGEAHFQSRNVTAVSVVAPKRVAAAGASRAPRSKAVSIAIDLKHSNSETRAFKPITPGRRHLRKAINDHLWPGKPVRKLTFVKKGHAKGGRNNTGRITVRHHGGGVRRRIRTVDYLRAAPGPHRVERIEYDPNRTAHLALVTRVATGEQSYIVASDGMRAGDVVQSFRAGVPRELLAEMGGDKIDPGLLAVKTAQRGNCLPIHMIPIGTQVYNIGSQNHNGAVFCRSAGTSAFVVSKDGTPKKSTMENHFPAGTAREFHYFKPPCLTVSVKLQSGEIRTVSPNACATIGVASNVNYQYEQLGKAGRSRWKNIRPTVRGVAMNACDHPHGGGRGKTKGDEHPRSIWGTLAKGGYKTRHKRNPNKYVVQERPRNHGKRRAKGN